MPPAPSLPFPPLPSRSAPPSPLGLTPPSSPSGDLPSLPIVPRFPPLLTLRPPLALLPPPHTSRADRSRPNVSGECLVHWDRRGSVLVPIKGWRRRSSMCSFCCNSASTLPTAALVAIILLATKSDMTRDDIHSAFQQKRLVATTRTPSEAHTWTFLALSTIWKQIAVHLSQRR